MKKIGGIAITLPLALAFTISDLKAQAAFPAPLTRASSGQLQCLKPNLARKTCQSISGYRYGANGAIENFYSILLSGDPFVTMESVSYVEIKGEKVCGITDTREIDAASFMIEGSASNPAQSALLRERLKLSLKGILDREMCASFAQDRNSKDKTTIVDATLDGAPYPGGNNQPVMWVSPADGFRVGQ